MRKRNSRIISPTLYRSVSLALRCPFFLSTHALEKNGSLCLVEVGGRFIEGSAVKLNAQLVLIVPLTFLFV